MKISKPKVLYISGSWPPIMCGVGDYLYKLTHYIKTPWAVITSKEADAEDNVFNIVRGWQKNDWPYIKKEVQSLDPEIIHYEYPSVMYGRKLFPNLLPNYLRKEFPKKRLIATVHEYHDASYLGKKRIELTLKHFDEIIVTNIEDKNMLKKKFPKKNFEIIRVGSNIDYDKLTKVSKKELEAELNLGDKKLVTYFGFIDSSKGVENLINSMADCNKSAKLVLATDHDPKNPYHKKINELIVSSGLDIHWTGYLSDEKVSHLLQISDLVVLPFDSPISTRRGSMIAAIGHGCCVVTTGPSEEIFVHQQNCYLMKDNSAKSISESINYLFKNESLLNKIKFEAKKTSKLFEWGIIAQEHDKKYKRIHK